MAARHSIFSLQEELQENSQYLQSGAAFPLGNKSREVRENNPQEEKEEEEWDDGGRLQAGQKRGLENTEAEPPKKMKMVEHKCPECAFKCYNDAELATHQTTSHGGRKKVKQCDNCGFSSPNVWEMDFHCRSRGHKVKKEEGFPCKKCSYVCVDKDDAWVHKKVHIPEHKLVECGDCVWCGDRLDNIRYHIHSQEPKHKMKIDYEAIALAKAEAKGPKEVAHYHKKLAKDVKMALKGTKS